MYSPHQVMYLVIVDTLSGNITDENSNTRSPLRDFPLHAPLPLERFLECPLTAPLPFTRCTARSAHICSGLDERTTSLCWPSPAWYRPRGRPRQSLAGTIQRDLKPFNLGLHSALRWAADRSSWRRIVESAMLSERET